MYECLADIGDDTMGMLDKIEQAISAQQEKEKTQVKSASKECPHRFGYLSGLPKGKPVPEECLVCPKMLECRNSSS